MPHRYCDRPDGPWVYEPNQSEYAALKASTADSARLYLISLGWRPGVQAMATEIEHTDFPPGTVLNELMQIHLVRWPEEAPELYWVLEFPGNYLPKAELYAKKHDLRLVPGVPTLLVADGKLCRRYFPADHQHMFTLENIPGHPLYENNPEKNEALRAQEMIYSETIPDVQIINPEVPSEGG